MSCGDPHETDCSEVLDHLYEYLDREMPDSDCEKFKEHFDECSPCFEKYGLEQEVKKLVKRCCGQDDVPTDLRSKVMSRIEVIRQSQGPEASTGGAGSAENAGAADVGAAETVEQAGSESVDDRARSHGALYDEEAASSSRSASSASSASSANKNPA